MFSKIAALALLGVAALSGVAGQQGEGSTTDNEQCQTAAEVIAEVVGPNFAQLLGRISAEEGAALLTQVAGAQQLLDEPVTLFIPTDKAFGDANANELSDEDLLTVLSTHAVQSEISSMDLKDEETFSAIGGSELKGVDEGPDGSVMVVGSAGPTAKVVDHDIPACSGPIHVIDMVLLPASIAGTADGAPAPAPEDMAPAPGPETMTRGLPGIGAPAPAPETDALGPDGVCSNVVEALLGMPDTSALGQIAASVLDPETVAVLTNPDSNLTVFAPPEDQLLLLLGGFQSGQVMPETVVAILEAHVATEYLPADELQMREGEMVLTVGGEALDVEFAEEVISLMSANSTVSVTEGDLDGCTDNAVIHKVDGVILPEGVTVDLESYTPGDLSTLPAPAPSGETLGPGAGPGTRGIGPAPGPESGDAAGVFRGLLTVGAAAVAVAVAL